MDRHLGAWLVVSLACTSTLVGCEGPVGPRGDPGPAGETGPRGPVGPPGDTPDAAVSDGGPAPGTITLEPAGLVGRVLDTAGDALAGGRVVLVPASEVTALGMMPIDPTLAPSAAALSTVDEPLEDLIDADGATLVSALIDVDGVYRFTTLADHDVFLVVMPPSGDAGHLPGGEHARIAQARASLVGRRVDLTVSTRPSTGATYVGSATCTGCHGRHEAFGTAHFVGLNVPSRRGYLEDTSRWPRFDAALARFEAGVTLHFYDCMPSNDPPCRVSEATPPASSVVSFDAALSRDGSVPLGEPGAYVVTLSNRLGAGSASYPVDLTYGGALARQAFIVPVMRTGGVERQVLPFQFQHDGAVTNASPAAWPWADVGSADWYDFAASVLRVPGSSASFDRTCAGCHFTGFQLHGDATSGFRASALPTISGDADYDLDGRLEEIDVGCEGCHGPGSEHVDAGGHGVAIVSPALLTAERADVICGTCHASASNGPPLDSSLHRPIPGLRRSELLASYLAGPELAAGDAWASGDPRHAQLEYVMHASSRMARNGRVLTSCSDCHDAHGRPDTTHDLLASSGDNALCTSCHDGAEFVTARTHVTTVGDPHVGLEDSSLVCTACHMPPTARGGAEHAGLRDATPASAVPVQYWVGDLATHRYRTSQFAVASTQPASVTQACALCHANTLPNP